MNLNSPRKLLAFPEFQLFGILLICVVLQTNSQGLDNEDVTTEDYGIVQVLLTVAILPITIGCLVNGVRNLKANLKSDLKLTNAAAELQLTQSKQHLTVKDIDNEDDGEWTNGGGQEQTIGVN